MLELLGLALALGVLMGTGPVGAATSGRVISDDVFGILCVFAESRSEPYEGQVAVGNVVRNRTKLRFYSQGTVSSTVLAPHQFSWMNTSDAQRCRVFQACWDEPAWQVASKAWFESEHTAPVGDALFYHATYVTPEWASSPEMQFVKQIGRHRFFRKVDP